MNSFEDLA